MNALFPLLASLKANVLTGHPLSCDAFSMEGVLLTRAYLESLTTNDLLGIADNFGVDVPDNPDRILLIEELLEINSADRPGALPSDEPELRDTVLTDSAPLPKQYNITFLEVMIRDPLWAFVFWEIKTSDKEQFEKAADFNGYYLKVSHADVLENQAGRNEDLFKVAVKPDDTAWYLGLSPVSADNASWSDQSRYKVEFCVDLGGVETVLAVSAPIRLPGLSEFPSAAGKQECSFTNCAGENQLVRLSGYVDFHVLRKNERQPRIKRSEGECPNE